MLNLTELCGFGAGSDDAHRYWRLNATASPNDFFNASEIEFRASAGGADQCDGGTAMASSSVFGTPAGAFDNSTGKWTSYNPLPQWVRYQFPSPVSVRQVSLTCATHFLNAPLASPTAFDLQWSDDGAAWTTLQSFTATWSGASPETKLFDVTV